LGKLLVGGGSDCFALEWPGAGGGAEHGVPDSARERIAIASYPFRDFIAGHDDKIGSGKMELKEFAAHVSAKFNIKKIEPWSAHFRSLEKAYLEEAAGGSGEGGRRDREHRGGRRAQPVRGGQRGAGAAVAFSKQWIDAAAAIGSPSVRTNLPQAKDSKPDLERTAESLKRVAEYGAAKKCGVNMENDNAGSEDPFFLVKVIERVNSAWLHALPDFANTLAAYEEPTLTGESKRCLDTRTTSRT